MHVAALVVQKDKLAGRPVFAMFSAHGVSYLYYTRGLWVVGPKLAGLVFKLAVTSPAKRPVSSQLTLSRMKPFAHTASTGFSAW